MGAEWRGGTGHRAERSTGPRSNAQKLARVAAQHKTGAKAKADGAPTTVAAESKMAKLEQRTAMRDGLLLQGRTGGGEAGALTDLQRHINSENPEALRRRAERRALKDAAREERRAARHSAEGGSDAFTDDDDVTMSDDSDDEAVVARRRLEVEAKVRAAISKRRAEAKAAAARPGTAGGGRGGGGGANSARK
jgi:hypothetical protein